MEASKFAWDSGTVTRIHQEAPHMSSQLTVSTLSVNFSSLLVSWNLFSPIYMVQQTANQALMFTNITADWLYVVIILYT